MNEQHVAQPRGFAIAIDGPVGVGKSTTARLVAQKLGMSYIDTGAMYRAVALYNTEKGVDLTNSHYLEQSLANIDIDLKHIEGEQRIFLNGRDVTEAIRTQEISEAASIVAAEMHVRKKLVAMQKRMAKNGKIVMDGRDIGSHVLPWAQVKIYLDADLETRAKRRMKDLESKGQPANFDKIRQETIVRDHRDKTRPISPLIKSADAIYIDTGDMPPHEVADKIIECVAKEEILCSTE